MPAIVHPRGEYRYLPAISAYSSGVAAEPGFEILGLRFAEPLGLAEALTVLDGTIERRGLTSAALCGLQMRSPVVLDVNDFGGFNDLYLELLDQRGLLIDGNSPLSRTNVVPVRNHLKETAVHTAFVVVPASGPRAADTESDYVVAGSGEAIGGLGAEQIVAYQDTTPSGLEAKRDAVLTIMRDRIDALGATPSGALATNVYTSFEIPRLAQSVLDALPASVMAGFTVYPSRPPVTDIDFEMDCARASGFVTL